MILDELPELQTEEKTSSGQHLCCLHAQTPTYANSWYTYISNKTIELEYKSVARDLDL